MIVPLGVSWVAKHFDTDADGNYVPRDPKNFVETIKSAIPLLRKQVPVKKGYSAPVKAEATPVYQAVP